MHTTQPTRRLLVLTTITVAALSTLLAVAPAGAVTECTDGPATKASVDRPHLADPAADDVAGENLPSPTGPSQLSDVRHAWISAVLLPDKTLDFSLHVSLSALPVTPGSYVHVNIVGDDAHSYVAYSAPNPIGVPGWRTVRTRTELDLGSAGGRTIMNVTGAAAGTVGAGGLVTFDIPEADLQGVDAVQLEVETGTLQQSQTDADDLHGLVRHDITQPSCTATLA